MKPSQKIFIELDAKGYRVEGNQVISPYGTRLRMKRDKHGHFAFRVRSIAGAVLNVKLHRYVAYLKYGQKMFEVGMIIRHGDGRLTNNHPDNLLLCPKDEAWKSKSEATRRRASLAGADRVRKYPHEEIVQRWREGWGIDRIRQEFGISSKGTVSFIINKSLTSRAQAPAAEEHQSGMAL